MKSKHEEGTFVKNEAILWKTIGLGFICHTPANLYGRLRWFIKNKRGSDI